MSDTIENPRQPLADAVQYAVDQVRIITRMLASRGVNISGLRYLELGPGTDLAPQLVLAGLGAEVTVADKFLTNWDPAYHPQFYRMFLAAFPAPCPAIEKALAAGGHEGTIRCLPEPAEGLTSVGNGSIDFVLSNAVLEHVLDIQVAASELRRVISKQGIQAHQIDFRDHRDFNDPLRHLVMPSAEYDRHRQETNARHGTKLRISEFVDIFSRYFWIEELEINGRAQPEYVEDILRQLPSDSPYANWPVSALVNLCGRIWLRPRAAHDQPKSGLKGLFGRLRKGSTK